MMRVSVIKMRRLFFVLCLISQVIMAKGFYENPLWDDGKAQYSYYAIEWPRYKQIFKGHVTLVLVKEPWNQLLNVKADQAKKSDFDVMKLNVIRSVPTGIYTYEQMTSLYYKQSDMKLLKLTASSQESCGLSFAYLENDSLNMFSYFEKSPKNQIRWKDSYVPFDGLSFVLRTWIKSKAPRHVTLFPSLLSNQMNEVDATQYALTKTTDKINTSIVFELKNKKIEHRFTFEDVYPHVLKSYEGSDGTVMNLKKSERLDYWNMNKPGFEAWKTN